MTTTFVAVPSEYFHIYTTYTLYVAIKVSFVAKFLTIITIYFYRLREEQHKKNPRYTVATGNIYDYLYLVLQGKRYTIQAYLYVQRYSVKYLVELTRLTYIVIVAFVLLGTGYPRPKEKVDRLLVSNLPTLLLLHIFLIFFCYPSHKSCICTSYSNNPIFIKHYSNSMFFIPFTFKLNTYIWCVFNFNVHDEYFFWI